MLAEGVLGLRHVHGEDIPQPSYLFERDGPELMANPVMMNMPVCTLIKDSGIALKSLPANLSAISFANSACAHLLVPRKKGLLSS